jgi:O-methyltransferase involved in polyketide biosynthesis
LPDVIELRKKFIPENERREFIASSFLGYDWFKRLGIEDHILFIAAGVLYYFEESQVKEFFVKIADNFPATEMVFDACSPRGLKGANKLVIKNAGMDGRSFLKWGLLDAGHLETWDSRIKLLGQHLYFKEVRIRKTSANKFMGFISDCLKMQYLVHLGFSKR